MQDEIREFGMGLGREAIARNWDGVRSLLAPWLRERTDTDAVRRFFEDEYRNTLAANGISELHHPQHPEPELDGNLHTNATELRKPISFQGGRVRPVPAELTDENFRYWLMMRLPCSETQMADLDFDFFAEVWMAVVQTDEGLRVGYWSQDAY